MHRYKLWILLFLLLFASNCYAWDYSYDTGSPLGSSAANQIDTAIQEHKKATVERINVDHEYGPANNQLNDLTCGYHRKVTMSNSNAVSAGVANVGIIHVEDANSLAELFYMDEDSNDVQITSGGAVYLGDPATCSNLTVSGDCTVNDDLVVVDDASFGGDVTVTGSISAGTGIAYANGQLAYETTDAHQVGGSSTTLAIATEYQAAVDGIVYFQGDGTDNQDKFLDMAEGAASGSLTDRVNVIATDKDVSNSMHVSKNYYWQVDASSAGTFTKVVTFKPKT